MIPPLDCGRLAAIRKRATSEIPDVCSLDSQLSDFATACAISQLAEDDVPYLLECIDALETALASARGSKSRNFTPNVAKSARIRLMAQKILEWAWTEEDSELFLMWVQQEITKAVTEAERAKEQAVKEQVKEAQAVINEVSEELMGVVEAVKGYKNYYLKAWSYHSYIRVALERLQVASTTLSALCDDSSQDKGNKDALDTGK